MRTILERLQVNESSNFDVESFIEQFKEVFHWDSLNYAQREIFADLFRSGGAIYDHLKLWWDQSFKTKDEELRKDLSDGKNSCNMIYKKLKDQLD